MPFKPGQSGNLNGKPTGTLSKKTKEWEELGTYIVQKGAKRYMNLLSKRLDDEYMDRFERILEYFKPKQQRREVRKDITYISEIKFIDE